MDKKAMDAPASSPGALAGLRVLDLTRVLAGPYCTMILGDMGAEVLKVELPGRGDDTRGWGPPFHGTEAAYFLGVNRNKRGITLNLKEPRGQAVLRELIKKSDVVVENFKFGTMAEWGCGPDFIRQQAPQVIHCTITGYSSRGPKHAAPGYDFLLQAESGLMSITGETSGEAMKMGVPIVDLCTGMYAAIAILGALNARNRGLPGQQVEVSLYTTGIALLANVASNALISGKPSGRYGNGHPNIVPYRSYRCSDADIAVTVGNDAQFERFSAALGHPEWVSDPRFARNRDRIVNRATIDALVEEALARRPVDEWIKTLTAAGVPCTRINNVLDALAAPQTAATGMVIDIEHPTAGLFRSLGIPMFFSCTPGKVRYPPPVLGEHTDAVLKEMLGLGEEEIKGLRADGII
ncbi:MAG: CoA transferase [Candidatus Korobacteraceae bacterium]|jgi:crotonobetainyl-CoA:carnitine CoA-transferase CaiB-like acyl-CoA transferase